MMTIIIVGSIALHVLSLVTFTMLYRRFFYLKTALTDVQEELQAAYSSMEMFVEEIEKGNEAFFEKLSQKKEQNERQEESQIAKAYGKRKNVPIAPFVPTLPSEQTSDGERELEEGVQQQSTATIDSSPEVAVTSETAHPSPKLFSRQEKYQQIEMLLKQGVSINEIAKQLMCGRGEVQLIANLVKKTNEG
jgi:hypothetical protein